MKKIVAVCGTNIALSSLMAGFVERCLKKNNISGWSVSIPYLEPTNFDQNADIFIVYKSFNYPIKNPKATKIVLNKIVDSDELEKKLLPHLQ